MQSDIEVVIFDNIESLSSYIDEQINNIEKRLNDLRAYMEKLRERVSKYEVLKRMLEELVGKEHVPLSTSVEITGLNLVLDPIPLDEYNVISEAHKAMSDKLNVLKKVKEVIDILSKHLSGRTVQLVVAFRSNIPIKIMIKTS